MGVPVREVPGKEGNTDGVVHELCAFPHAGHNDNSGGGKSTPTTVTPMRHDGAMGDPKRLSTQHYPLNQGEGSEVAQAGGKGGQRRNGQGL